MCRPVRHRRARRLPVDQAGDEPGLRSCRIHQAGNDILPADHGILEEKFRGLPFGKDVDGTLAPDSRARIPLFADMNGLVLRELVLASDLLTPNPGDVIFRKNDYTNSFITIIEGDRRDRD